MCNLYLQDRQLRRTPRYRGVTVLQDLKSTGIPVTIASDHSGDPCHGYGDLDCLEVLTQNDHIAHRDRPIANWPLIITCTPADLMRLTEARCMDLGQPADLVLFKT